MRNLGFIIDQELNRKDHIIKLCQSCYYQLRQIRTVRNSLISSAIQTLVHAFICTRVDFSNSLLHGTSAYLLDRLQSVLNSAARLILRIRKYDPISAAIRRDLHWLPIPFRIRYKLNSITSNCLAGRAPEYLIELCHPLKFILMYMLKILSSPGKLARGFASGSHALHGTSSQTIYRLALASKVEFSYIQQCRIQTIFWGQYPGPPF